MVAGAELRHLERTDGWITLFRNLNGAVYLRNNDRNQANLDRVVTSASQGYGCHDREHDQDTDADQDLPFFSKGDHRFDHG